MTVAVAPRKILFPSINGSTGPFSFSFRTIVLNGIPQIRVVRYSSTGVPTTLVLGIDYTFVATNNGLNGGIVTLLVAGTSGQSLLISGNTTRDQPIKYANQSRFFPEVHETSYDQLTLIAQEQTQDIDRSIKVPLADVSPVTEFPLAALRANKAAIFDASGNLTVSVDNYNDQVVNATAQAVLASQWATLTTGIVASTDYSAKAWAIGGTGVTGVSTRGSAKDWAISATSPDGSSNLSAKTYATNAAASALAAQTFAGGTRYLFSTTTTMADPSSGNLRFNNATVASVTQIAISETNADSSNIAAFISSFDDATAAVRGYLTIRKDASTFAIFGITGSSVDNGTWQTLNVTHIASSGTFLNGDTLSIGFAQSGNNGAGTGDFSSNTATSVDGEVMLFSGTTGKLGRRATGTGFVRSTAGVFSTQTDISNTDINAAAGIVLSKLATQAANTIVANVTGSTAVPTAQSLSAVLDMVGSAARGDILYRGASTWTRLGAGTSGNFLRTNGVGADPSWAAISTSVVTVKSQVFTGSGTYTPSAGMLFAQVEAIGGGGGTGGGDNSSNRAGAGAGAGGYAYGLFSAGTIGVSQTVTIGAAGTAGAASGSPGTTGGNGGNTTFGALLTANGGIAGGAPPASGGTNEGADGGTATVGSILISGMPGFPNSAANVSGTGGSTKYGVGGKARGVTSGQGSGRTGSGYGAGASGCLIAGTAQAGGAGTAGVVIITEYCSQ